MLKNNAYFVRNGNFHMMVIIQNLKAHDIFSEEKKMIIEIMTTNNIVMWFTMMNFLTNKLEEREEYRSYLGCLKDGVKQKNN